MLTPRVRILPVSMGLLLGSLLAPSASAQEPAAPASYIEAVEEPADAGGVMDEVDAEQAQVEAGAPGLSEEARNRVEQIVVTARKRAELLEDTPVSITALSENLLREANITRFSEIENLVPNMEFLGNNSNGRIYIRGVGQAQTGAAFDSGVGLYIDGIYLPRSQVLVFDVVDITAIEVLRGPQGTLFGKNTVGGAINVTTAKPSDTLEASAWLNVGNRSRVESRVMLNIPIDIGWFEDRLATRIAFASENHDGFNTTRYPNPATGEPARYISSVANLSFLGSLQLEILPELILDVSGSWLENRAVQGAGECVIVKEQGLGLGDPDYYPACRATRPYEYSANRRSNMGGRNWGSWGTLAWSPGQMGFLEDLSLKYIGAWRGQNNHAVTDLDMTDVSMLILASDGGGPGFLLGKPGQSEQVQQELQMNASTLDGRLNFVSGLFGFWETAERGNATIVPPISQRTLNETRFRNWTWAVYGQGTLDVTEWLGLTVGLRYTQDKKGAWQKNKRLTETGEVQAITKTGKGSEIFEAWTPLVNVAMTLPEQYLDESPLDHLMGYVSWSQGFKGGGFNAVINPADESDEFLSFGPETLDNFEVGLKTVAFDRTLTVNLSVFAALYNDIQVRTFQPVYDEAGELETLLSLTLNAAASVNRGVELDFNWRPAQGWRVEGSLGLLDARYTDFPVGIDNVNGQQINRSGQRLPAAMPIQSYMAVQYSLPVDGAWVGPLRGWLTPRIDWSYRSGVNWIGPELAAAEQPAYNTLGLRLSYDFWDDRAQFALWARNLTDKRASTAGVSLASFYGVYQRPWMPGRTFGAEFAYAFN
jgi:iron complex outermembrane receptor protein